MAPSSTATTLGLTLHLLPVLTSTASLTFCLTEFGTFLPLVNSYSIPASALSPFWDSYLYLTMPGWLGFGVVSSVSGFIGWRNTTGTVKSLYEWGALFALSHYAFGPSVSKLIQKMVHGPANEAKAHQRTWLKLHTIRTLSVDLPAFICFLSGFLSLLAPGKA